MCSKFYILKDVSGFYKANPKFLIAYCLRPTLKVLYSKKKAFDINFNPLQRRALLLLKC